jgi:hypothetical protein
MDDATGEAEGSGLRVAFDRRLKLEFHGATVTSDAGLLAFRELDDALGLTALAGDILLDPRTGKNGRHTLLAQFRHAATRSRPWMMSSRDQAPRRAEAGDASRRDRQARWGTIVARRYNAAHRGRLRDAREGRRRDFDHQEG